MSASSSLHWCFSFTTNQLTIFSAKYNDFLPCPPPPSHSPCGWLWHFLACGSMAGAGLIGCIHASLQETAALPSACGTRQRLYRASAALGKGPSANFKSAKGSLPSIFYRALGKGFAECLLGGTRQRKVTVMTGYKLTVVLPSVSKKGTRQRIFF
jgi:hypothetical protein